MAIPPTSDLPDTMLVRGGQPVSGEIHVRGSKNALPKAMVASGAIDVTLADLRERGVVYEEGGAVWLRSTDYGDDKDRVLIKSDGEFTYLHPRHR